MSEEIEVRRKIIGTGFLTWERVKKERKTTNTTKQLIEREKIRCLVLECGHFLAFNSMPNRRPKHSIRCRYCSSPSAESVADARAMWGWVLVSQEREE